VRSVGLSPFDTLDEDGGNNSPEDARVFVMIGEARVTCL